MLVNNKRKEFAESLRNIMREDENGKINKSQKPVEDIDEETRSLQELLEEKFNELFGPLDDE